MSNLCANGCGFFGHPSTRNLCSQCYKKFVLKSSSNVTLAAVAPAPARTEDSSTTSNNNNRRCKSCNKKIGLLGFTCRCGGSFCGVHRYPENHVCTHDFRTPARSSLSEANPLCRGDKHPDRL